MSKASFSLGSRNPDVLTCIANLSNDEVFTPPEFANRMLDDLAESWSTNNGGANIWADPDVRFLDPFTKSGVFLREIIRRLVSGLQSEIPDLQARVDHVVEKQVFGIGITQLTSLLARRTVYCSKFANGNHSVTSVFENEDGNIWFERQEHTWAGGRTRVLTADSSGEPLEQSFDGRCKFCGASQKEYSRETFAESHAYALLHSEDPNQLITKAFGEKMKFDVVIGNPPYQLNDGGNGASASPIYQRFIEQAKKLEPSYIEMVIPARWYSGGKGLDEFRDVMIRDERISKLEDFPDSRDCFPQVDIAGGICYFLWDSQHSGPCEIATNRGGIRSTSVRQLREQGLDVFLREAEAISILEKIRNVEIMRGANPGLLALPPELSFSSQVSARKPFGLPTNAKIQKRKPSGHSVEVLSSAGRGWVGLSEITTGRELLPKWLLYTSKASHDHAGQPDKDGTRRVLSKLDVLPPGVAVTESYIILGAFESEIDAKKCQRYAASRFFRYLVSLRANTQDITQTRFSFVPLMPSEGEDDGFLFAHYGFSDSEIDAICARIRPMELDID
jgi:adenine-specific DNA methylase